MPNSRILTDFSIQIKFQTARCNSRVLKIFSILSRVNLLRNCRHGTGLYRSHSHTYSDVLAYRHMLFS